MVCCTQGLHYVFIDAALMLWQPDYLHCIASDYNLFESYCFRTVKGLCCFLFCQNLSLLSGGKPSTPQREGSLQPAVRGNLHPAVGETLHPRSGGNHPFSCPQAVGNPPFQEGWGQHSPQGVREPR